MMNYVSAWGGSHTVEEAVERVRAVVTEGTSEEELLLIALERQAFVAASQDSSAKDVEVYGKLRWEIVKRMKGGGS